MNKEKLFRYFFIGVFALLILQALHILSPFFTGIFGAIILSLIFWPIHKISVHMFGIENPNFAAAVSTAILIILIVFPLCVTGWMLYKEIHDAYPALETLANTLQSWRGGENPSDSSIVTLIQTKLHALVRLSGINLEHVVKESMNAVTNSLILVGKALPKNAFFLFANIVVMITSLFFLFRDGPALFDKLKDLTPMDDKHKDHIVHQLYITMTAVVRGVLIVAILQGLSAALGFAIIRVPSPILLGFMTTLLAIVPMVGAGIVWLLVSIYYFIAGAFMKSLFIFLWGFFIVSLVDNFLRPYLIGGGTRIPFLAMFLGLVGGIRVYGPMGIFFGPLIVALILAFIKIYREEYSGRQKKGEKPQDGAQ